MKLKRTLIAVGATGAAAAMAFSGSAVSTAFSTQSVPHSVSFSTGQTNVHVDGNFALKNLVPLDGSAAICDTGTPTDWSDAGSVTVKNTGGVDAEGSVTFTNPSYNGPTDSTNLGYLQLDLTLDGAPVTQAQAVSYVTNHITGNSVDLGEFAPGVSHQLDVKLCLDGAAGNAWQGKQFSSGFTVTMQSVHS